MDGRVKRYTLTPTAGMGGMTYPPTGDDSAGSREGIVKEELFSILASTRCRHVLQFFQASTIAVASVEDLITYMTEHDETIDTREQAAIALTHVALPKLVDAGIIEYDRRNTTVRYRGHPLLEAILHLVAEMEAGT